MVQICYFDYTDMYPTSLTSSLLETIFLQHKTNRIGNIRRGLERSPVVPHSCFLLPHYTVKEQIVVKLFEAVWNEMSTEKLKNRDPKPLYWCSRQLKGPVVAPCCKTKISQNASKLWEYTHDLKTNFSSSSRHDILSHSKLCYLWLTFLSSKRKSIWRC